ncbi:MAG TPA: hypothetical protein VFH90_06660 [Candidatus Limnocylindria bacterium]|nr:hypothetical protein [Candidatus Limnocylindria bacterium]
MRRFFTALVAASLLTVSLVGLTFASKPAQTCGAAASGYFIVDVDEWWDITVAGFEAEGIDVYEDDGVTFTQEFNEFAAAFGLGDGAGLEFFVKVEQWAGIDHNDNGLVCMKTRPHTPGNPAYFFNGVDDEASSPQSA